MPLGRRSLSPARASTRPKVDLGRTVIRAPIDGVVARRQVQLGQRVQPSTPLLSVVPVDQAVCQRELQGSAAHQGARRAAASSSSRDLYRGKVVYHGVVEGFDGGTGAAFALIPAQNATGNWIKVVQRLPVRIRLNPDELAAHPLRVGLSMDAKVDLSSNS